MCSKGFCGEKQTLCLLCCIAGMPTNTQRTKNDNFCNDNVHRDASADLNVGEASLQES